MNTEMELKSSTYYQSITGIKYIPKVIHYDICPLFKKGDIVSVKKHWFKQPEVKYAEEDIYDGSWIDWYGHKHKLCVNAKEYARKINISYDEETKEFYSDAKVIVSFKNGSTTLFKFKTDAEAMVFIDDLKTRCEECGNKLL